MESIPAHYQGALSPASNASGPQPTGGTTQATASSSTERAALGDAAAGKALPQRDAKSLTSSGQAAATGTRLSRLEAVPPGGNSQALADLREQTQHYRMLLGQPLTEFGRDVALDRLGRQVSDSLDLVGRACAACGEDAALAPAVKIVVGQLHEDVHAEANLLSQAHAALGKAYAAIENPVPGQHKLALAPTLRGEGATLRDVVDLVARGQSLTVRA